MRRQNPLLISVIYSPSHGTGLTSTEYAMYPATANTTKKSKPKIKFRKAALSRWPKGGLPAGWKMLLSQDHTVIMAQIKTHAAANPRPNETQSMNDVSWVNCSGILYPKYTRLSSLLGREALSPVVPPT
jgi:hypothetical protein